MFGVGVRECEWACLVGSAGGRGGCVVWVGTFRQEGQEGIVEIHWDSRRPLLHILVDGEEHLGVKLRHKCQSTIGHSIRTGCTSKEDLKSLLEMCWRDVPRLLWEISRHIGEQVVDSSLDCTTTCKDPRPILGQIRSCLLQWMPATTLLPWC